MAILGQFGAYIDGDINQRLPSSKSSAHDVTDFIYYLCRHLHWIFKIFKELLYPKGYNILVGEVLNARNWKWCPETNCGRLSLLKPL